MYKKLISTKTLFFVILLNLFVISCSAQNHRVKWTIKNAGLIRAFWTEDGKHIGYVSNEELILSNFNGETLWKLRLTNNPDVTNHLKILTSDGLISKLAINDGTRIWEKRLSSNNLIIQESIDGFFATSPIPMFNHLKVYSESGEMIWDYSGDSFNPFVLLPEGKFAIGTSYNNTKSQTDVNIIGANKDIKTILNLKDSYFIESPQPLISVNKTTKQTMIVIGTASWWSIISNRGEIIINNKQIPLSKVRFTSSCGLGFALANNTENKIAVVSEEGKLLWTKTFKSQIQAITGNASFLAVSVGNLGYPGKVLLFNKNGEEEGTVYVDLTLNHIEIADSKPLLIGVLNRSRVQLLDFTR